MEDLDIKELRRLVEEVMWAQSKAAAKSPLHKLQVKASMLSDAMSSNAYYKLGEIIAYASSASGQVRDKDHWVSVTEDAWFVFQGLALRKPH